MRQLLRSEAPTSDRSLTPTDWYGHHDAPETQHDASQTTQPSTSSDGRGVQCVACGGPLEHGCSESNPSESNQLRLNSVMRVKRS